MKTFLYVILLILLDAQVVFAISPFGVVTVPVANLREEPRHGSELMSQAIMGTPLKINSRQGEWYAVTMPDGYEGFMIGNSIALMDKTTFQNWQTSARAYVTEMAANLLSAPDKKAPSVSPLQLSDIVEVTDSLENNFLKVRLPDGREGFVEETYLEEFKPFGNGNTSVAEIILKRGESLLGQEYLWGGTSAKAADCSGFTRILFQASGTYLPRDAWQQALEGKQVMENELLPGDLIFFSNAKGKVNHVGIYAGDGMMLHCSGRVKLDRIVSDEKGSELYPVKPSQYRRMLTGAPLKSDVKANDLYFNN